MRFRRAVQCVAVTCVMTLALPQVARADNGNGGGGHWRTTFCNTHLEVASTGAQPATLGSELALLKKETSREHDSRANGHGFNRFHPFWWFWRWFLYWLGRHCAVQPPAEIPEAPQVLMLSTTAVVTGGAALLIIRRRSRHSTVICR